MKDSETLTHHKLADGYVVHLVIKSSARGPQDPSSSGSTSTTASGNTASNNNTTPNQSQTTPSTVYKILL